MDNSTTSNGECALAKLFYMAICELQPNAETRQKALDYWRTIVISPWDDVDDRHSREHAQQFFLELVDMQYSTNLKAKWATMFDPCHLPKSPQTARGFLSNCFQLLLHKPRTYHDFFCQQQSLSSGHIIDFPITHPIAVEFWTLYSTLSGAGIIKLKGGKKISLQEGVIALIPPGCECVVARDNNEAIWRFDWLSFRPRVEWLELMDWAFSLDHPMIISIKGNRAQQYLKNQLEELQTTTYQRGDINERLCYNIIENLLIRLRRLNDSNTEPTLSDPRIHKAVHYLLPRYRNNLSLKNIATHVNLSPSRLNALFREHYGTSLIRWRDKMRLQKAQELLSHTDMSISAIAQHVGYEDPLYFSRRFRKYFGHAPTLARKISRAANVY